MATTRKPSFISKSYIVLHMPLASDRTVDTIKAIDAWSSTGTMADARRMMRDNLNRYAEAHGPGRVRVIESSMAHDELITDHFVRDLPDGPLPGQAVRVTELGARRVMDGKAGMVFVVKARSLSIDGTRWNMHVADYRYPSANYPYQVWTLGAGEWEPIAD